MQNPRIRFTCKLFMKHIKNAKLISYRTNNYVVVVLISANTVMQPLAIRKHDKFNNPSF